MICLSFFASASLVPVNADEAVVATPATDAPALAPAVSPETVSAAPLPPVAVEPATSSPVLSQSAAEDQSASLVTSDENQKLAGLRMDDPFSSVPQIEIKTKLGDSNKDALKLAAAGLLLLPMDKSLVKWFPRQESNGKSDGLTETVNMFGDRNLLLAGLGGMYVFGKKGTKDTAKTALAALLNSGSMTQGLKMLSGRSRPDSPADAGDFSGPGSDNGDSFPSGHTSAAFAVATVLAAKRPKHKWLYYGLAAAVGLARIRKSAHFPSDVLVGAGVGTYAGKQALKGEFRLFGLKF